MHYFVVSQFVVD